MDVWAGYRRRRTLTWAFPLKLMAIAFVLALTDSYNGPWLFIVAIITFGVLHVWFEHWPCPRCGKPFTNPKRDLTYSKACLNCGLGLWKRPKSSVLFTSVAERFA